MIDFRGVGFDIVSIDEMSGRGSLRRRPAPDGAPGLAHQASHLMAISIYKSHTSRIKS